jgi:hypothetical protein
MTAVKLANPLAKNQSVRATGDIARSCVIIALQQPDQISNGLPPQGEEARLRRLEP